MSAQSRMNFCVTSNEHFKSDINKSKYVFLQLGTNQRDQKKKKKEEKNLRRANFHPVKRTSRVERKRKKKRNAGHAWHVRVTRERNAARARFQDARELRKPRSNGTLGHHWKKYSLSLSFFFMLVTVTLTKIVSCQSSSLIIVLTYRLFVCSTIHFIPWRTNWMKFDMTKKWYLFLHFYISNYLNELIL